MNSSEAAARDTLFVGDGELATLMSRRDWGATPLGPVETWPESLKSVVRMMLASRYQMWMGWGPDLAFLYNDAYRPTLGVKHPHALATPASEVWSEVWGELGPLVDRVLGSGQATYNEGMLLLLERSGFPEETYHTFSYSPLFDDDARIAGLFCVVVEESDRVINDRRLATLRDLASATAPTNTEAELFDAVCARLDANPRDLPFTVCYLFEGDGEGDPRTARLVCATGLEAGHAAAPAVLDLEAGPWPEAPATANDPGDTAVLAGRFADLPQGAWDKPPRQALLLPFGQRGSDKAAAGFIIAGVNPYRPLDAGYRGFVELLSGQIGAALANVRAYEAERRRAEALAEIDRAKTAFFSNVSHEFRTPLTLILGPLEEVLAAPAALDPPSHSQVELAHRNGVRLLRLVNSLLDFSRIEAGRVQGAFEATDFAAFSADIAASFRSTIEKAGLALRVSGAPLGEPVYLDRDMWEKILMNLLSNAFKYTFEGEIAVETRLSADGRHAEAVVSDTGIGVAADQVPRLFERFHRIEGARGRSFEGTGIGLALVRELVTLHGGSIGVESEPGRGTTFRILIPLGVAHLPPDRVRSSSSALERVDARAFVGDALRWLPDIEGPAIDASASHLENGADSRDANAPGVGKTILFVDDNADMRDYVVRLLEEQGYSVLALADGRAALARARSAPPDLILSDVMMPELDGFGLLQAVRADPEIAGVPVILLSARAGEEAKVEGLGQGADDYLVKPFAARELLARVNANIQLATARREAARSVMRSERLTVMTQERLSLALSTGRVSVFEWQIEPDNAVVHGPLVEAFGVSAEDAARGMPLRAFLGAVHADDVDQVVDGINAAVETGAPYDAEQRVQKGDMTYVIAARGQIQIADDGRPRMVGALIDITREKAAERALQALNVSLETRVEAELANRIKAEEALRQAQKMEAVGQLTGGVAHDFNNLLTVIIGGLDTIRRARPGDDARIRRAAEMARKGAERAASLTGRLLAFSRRQPLKPSPLKINELVRDMTELLHRTLGEAVELEGVLAPRLWMAEIDQNQLEMAILNLAVNARDAMPDGGKLTLETSNTELDETYAATQTEVVPGQYVMVAVSDTGFGMSSDGLARAFEPFYTTKEVGRGTGLGLSMVYGFVKQSGGHVAIYSEVGRGTTVRLYFPRYSGETAEIPAVARDQIPGASRDEVVLVVEDNDDVRVYSVLVLKELGYGVLEAATADAALDILARESRVDLLFTDVVLPGKTGRVLADAALILRPGLPILYTTGYARNAIVHGGRLDPGVRLITKPFTFETLGLAVRDAIDR